MAAEYAKCSGCKCLHHIVDEYEVYKGTRRKTCLKCKAFRNKNKCEHGHDKPSCKECGGSKICKHGRIKQRCKECGGGSICTHDRLRTKCKECGGGSLCEHGKIKNECQECDPVGHLKKIVSERIRHALKSDKSKHSIEYLGCSIEQFKEHIGFQFETGMNWDNYCKVWHIDHITPIKYKQDGKEPSLDDTIKRLHWTNTQPMFAEENIAKGNKFIGKISGYDKTIKEQCLAFNAFK